MNSMNKIKRIRISLAAGAIGVITLAISPKAFALSAAECGQLVNLVVPHTTITSAAIVSTVS